MELSFAFSLTIIAKKISLIEENLCHWRYNVTTNFYIPDSLFTLFLKFLSSVWENEFPGDFFRVGFRPSTKLSHKIFPLCVPDWKKSVTEKRIFLQKSLCGPNRLSRFLSQKISPKIFSGALLPGNQPEIFTSHKWTNGAAAVFSRSCKEKKNEMLPCGPINTAASRPKTPHFLRLVQILRVLVILSRQSRLRLLRSSRMRSQICYTLTTLELYTVTHS